MQVEDVHLKTDAVVSLSATTSGQMSNAHPNTKHGLFTYFLLRAIRGEADENDDRWVSVKEVYDFVKNHVTRVSRAMGTEQTPVIAPPLEKLKDIAISLVLR